MVESDNVTLMVRHFPSEVSPEDRVGFMKHFGAQEVKCVESKSKKNCLIFARFESKALADAVLKKLHQVKLFGQLLSVEFARNNEFAKNLPPGKTSGEEVKEEKSAYTKYYDNFLHRLTSWTSVLNFQQPPPSHLKYQYPPPSAQVLRNIAVTLASVPKFYTQVLHLMNKMNLPCPFNDYFPVESDLVEYGFEGAKAETYDAGTDPVDFPSSSESEISSDSEVPSPGELIPEKRRKRQAAFRVKRPKFLKPLPRVVKDTPSVPVRPGEVFENPKKEIQSRKIELKLSAELTPSKPTEEEQEKEVVQGFELIEPQKKMEETTGDSTEGKESEEITQEMITSEELASNRISSRDQRLLPVFKSYQAGIPSCRLYVKNLAKSVVARDLHYIYRRFFKENHDEQGTMFDIRLMQEGRMKGQAFITLQSVALAERALKETNGYILKDKPMVVQFARSSKNK